MARAKPRIYRLTRKYEEMARDRANRIGSDLLREIQRRAPVDTGRRPSRRGPRHLRNSYYLRMAPNGNWQVVATKRYWRFVEFGTLEHGDAQPHVYPAKDYIKAKYRL